MTPQQILITGATGRIGRVIAETLLRETDSALFLMARDPARLGLAPGVVPHVTLLPGDMRAIRQHAPMIRAVDAAVLTAAHWVGPEAFEINVTRTLELLGLLNPEVCRHVLYFSTASILDYHKRPLPEAGTLGTGYIRSKYEQCLQRLPEWPIAGKITVLFPTLVVGGDAAHPDHDFGPALPRGLRLLRVLRFLDVDGSFHFIHARDLGRVARHVLDHPPATPSPRYLVVGQPRMTVNQAIDEVCAYLGWRTPFRIPVGVPVLRLLLESATPAPDRPWTRFCLNYRHFTYSDVVNPVNLGLPSYCPTATDVLRIYDIPRAGVRPP